MRKKASNLLDLIIFCSIQKDHNISTYKILLVPIRWCCILLSHSIKHGPIINRLKEGSSKKQATIKTSGCQPMDREWTPSLTNTHPTCCLQPIWFFLTREAAEIGIRSWTYLLVNTFCSSVNGLFWRLEVLLNNEFNALHWFIKPLPNASS